MWVWGEGLGGGRCLEIRSGKGGGGAANKEKEPREEMVRPPKSGPPFTAVAWLASGAPYSGHGGGEGYPHDTAWTVPKGDCPVCLPWGGAFMC